MQVLLFLHNSMFVITHGSIDSLSSTSFFGALVAIQGFFKIGAVSKRYEEIKELKMQIDNISDRVTLKNRLMFSNDFKKFRGIVHYMFSMTYVSSIIFYILVPLLTILLAFVKGETIPKIFTFHHWFPFDPFNHYISVRIYNLTLIGLTYNCTTSLEGYIILTFGQLSILFRSLAKDIVEIVDEFDEKLSKLTEKRLIMKIELHIQLIEITRKMAEMYEIAFLAHTLCFVVGLCFILLKALVVDSGSDVYSSMINVFNMALYFFYICYFGEKVTEGVSIITH